MIALTLFAVLAALPLRMTIERRPLMAPGEKAEYNVAGLVPFFPPDFDEAYYLKHYAAMRETSIWHDAFRDPGTAVYRFLYLPAQMLIRVDVREDGEKHITFKRTPEGAGHEPGKLSLYRREVMSEEDFSAFTNLLEKADFWNLPHEMPEDGGGFDGTQHIMEAAKDDRYHVVSWWTPEDGAFSSASWLLLRLGFAEEFNLPTVTLSAGDYARLALDFELTSFTGQRVGWTNKESAVSLFGLPHEATTTDEGSEWSYYCKNHDKLFLVFDVKGDLQKTYTYEKFFVNAIND